jgi:hypothetical protein
MTVDEFKKKAIKDYITAQIGAPILQALDDEQAAIQSATNLALISYLVGKLSGTRLRSSRLKINETGRACLMAASSWPSDDRLRAPLVWPACSEIDDIADPRQSSAGP